MQRRSLKLIATVLLLGSPALSQQGWADEALVQAPAGSSNARLKLTRDQTTLPIVLDFAKILTFDQPARTIIIGNPGIVDGTLSDDTTIVLTGKSIGTTNMIVLGEGGQEIANLRVNVSANARQMTTVDHGGVQQTYSCVDTCRPVGKADPAK
ncbi:pilus assembly protein N-terminal domain-containing protein [Microvirga sp. G4-2]|uniref:pilus assembly protein N-terminal domain-containing protein n=1 Tax=Microvirga sp. G4-2 TaxID=3434467 RepID=UPI0040451148